MGNLKESAGSQKAQRMTRMEEMVRDKETGQIERTGEVTYYVEALRSDDNKIKKKDSVKYSMCREWLDKDLAILEEISKGDEK